MEWQAFFLFGFLGSYCITSEPKKPLLVSQGLLNGLEHLHGLVLFVFGADSPQLYSIPAGFEQGLCATVELRDFPRKCQKQLPAVYKHR